MQHSDGRLVLSATDLTKHVACPHITTLDLSALDIPASELGATEPDDALNLIFAKGLAHEHDYLKSLRAEGLEIVEISTDGVSKREAEAATVEAMRAGADVVYQATLFDGAWIGYADFLVKRNRPSALGQHSYDIADTKLARRLKVPALLQMATYAERLTQLQGVPPRHLIVVTGDKEQHPWRLVDVAPYARRRREDLLGAVKDQTPTEAVPNSQCGQCRWKDKCEGQWVTADDLIQVAGIRSVQRTALREAGLTTMAKLATASRERVVSAIGAQGADALITQANLQVQERETGLPAYKLLALQPGQGLQRLPVPSAGDVYLDFEGDPWVDDGGGREYLAGLWDRTQTFTSWWAHDFAEEKKLVKDLIDELMARWREHEDMHVYHYAAYEQTALKRLTGHYGTREAELDQLLRAERLVDLYAVVRQGVQISKSSYSIKKVEDFYWGRTRPAGLVDGVGSAMDSVIQYERWLVEPDQAILDQIEKYNRDDVRSTHDLHGWLEELRNELGAQGVALERPTPAEPPEVKEAEWAEIELASRLVDADQELVAGLVGWHRREARPAWWEFFKYTDLELQELIDDTTAIGGLAGPEQVGAIAKSKVWRYSFPPQDCKIAMGKYVPDVDTHVNLGKVVGADAEAGWIDIQMGASKTPTLPRGLGQPGPLQDEVLRASLAETAAIALDGGDSLALRLIRRRVPSRDVLARAAHEDPADVVARVGADLTGEVLAVQGPPGTGKTYAAALLIRDLLDRGLRVGVTALSHSVIGHVLKAVGRPALQKVSSIDEDATETLVRLTTSNDQIYADLFSSEANLVGGSAWLWARPELRESVDVLVIDEAGQFSLANAVAVCPAAKSLVLLGDPQQLTQPTQATHPYGAGASALEHILEGHETMPPDRGVFLEKTYRMHPSVTAFVSELSYEDRLEPVSGLERQIISGTDALGGHGLRWLPVSHEGCTSCSMAEAEVVARLVTDLLGRSWTNEKSVDAPLGVEDVLVVAPFNAQVAALRAALPSGVRAGTVDKFQGREAPVVIYSMTSSSAEDAPRGVSFLFDVHRLTVAVSRARALCVVVGSPALLDAPVHTPEQLRAVNALCRYVDEATSLALT